MHFFVQLQLSGSHRDFIANMDTIYNCWLMQYQGNLQSKLMSTATIYQLGGSKWPVLIPMNTTTHIVSSGNVLIEVPDGVVWVSSS